LSERGTSVTIPDIVDNSRSGQRLCDVLNTLMKVNNKAHFASGYFNLDGYGLVKDTLDTLTEFRLLLGREPTLTDSAPLGTLLGMRLREELEDKMGSGEMPPLIADFVDFLSRESVQVRLYSKRFFHGKAYILEGMPLFGSVAVVGSSNFTAAGLTSNSELNSVHKQESAVHELKEWYERFWDESEDYKQELIELLTAFIETHSPYDIYMKALFELFKDQLDVPMLESPESAAIELSEFQEDGYRNAQRIVERYNGVLIADSVGLGKTFLGLRFLDEYAYKLRQKALVICPAQLRDILWRPILNRYRIFTVMRSQEEISQSKFSYTDYADCDWVLVDESHNFRNTSANRYDNLMRILTTGKPKKLVLMTATPVNNSIFDLYNQVRFITRDKDDAFAEAGIPSLWGYFLIAQTQNRDLYDLLEEVSVRRTRQYIKRNYPKATINGKRVKFPERELHTVRYNLETAYAGLYEDCARVVQRLNFAPYMLEGFRRVKPDPVALARQNSLVALMQILYLKRLESSLISLRISLGRQYGFQKRFLELLKEGRLLNSASYRRIFAWVGADDSVEYEPDVEQFIADLPEVRAEDYDLEAITQAVQADMNAIGGVLQNIQLRFGDDIGAMDAKIHQLKELLLGELKGKKVIVFTYFKDTARYLYHELGGRDVSGSRRPQGEEFLHQLGHERVRIVDSIVRPRERYDIIKRFAPVSNEADDIKGTEQELDLLISTDVLSEGQNLQDADTVINYDLHWNPVRMIQRAGRIDRIGSLYDLVHLYNFFPEDKLEDLLNIMKGLQAKIEDIRRTVGLDAKILDPSEVVDPKDFNTIRDIAKEKKEVVDDLEAQSELDIGDVIKQELLDYLKSIGRERVENIPLGVGSGLRKEDAHGLFVYLKGRERHFWCYYDMTKDRDPITERKLEIIKTIRCDEQTERVEPDFDVYPIIDRCKRHIIQRLKRQIVKPPTLRSPQNQVVNWLQARRAETDMVEVADLIAYFSQPLPAVLLTQLRKLWRGHRDDEPDVLQDQLRHFTRENIVPDSGATVEVEAINEDRLQLVCWLAVM